MTWDDFDIAIASLCTWREARGEGTDGMRAVLHVIQNRAQASRKTWAEIVYARLQFSSMTYGSDPELCMVPAVSDPQFAEIYSLAQAVRAGSDADLTNGATHYFADSIPMPSWAQSMTETVKIGHQTFFK